MSPSDIETAKALTEEGNELYKQNALSEAINMYTKAFKLDPTNCRPLRNLSSAYYGVGQYRLCQLTAIKAIKFEQESGNEDVVQVEKLEKRIEKAKAHMYEASANDQTRRRLEIIEWVPRYRPDLIPSTTYATVGHDNGKFLFSDLDTEDTNDVISGFMGDCSDCRHVLETLIEIVDQEKNKKLSPKRYHFTTNDIHNSIVARNLVVWALLEELSTLEQGTDDAIVLLTTIFFVFVGNMMPKHSSNKLHQVINRLRNLLTDGNQRIEWVYLHEKDFLPLSNALYIWESKVPQMIQGADVIRDVTQVMAGYSSPGPGYGERTALRNEKLLYSHSAGLYPPSRFMELHEKGMKQLLETHGDKLATDAQKFRDYFQEHWRVNPTLFAISNNCKVNMDFDLDHQPFTITNSSKPRNGTRLFEDLSPLFMDAARALDDIRSRLKVEVYCGDVVDLAEKIRFDLFSQQEKKLSRPKDFPTTYHKMNLSSVPDYIGGDLSTNLYAMPLVKREPLCRCEVHCQANPQCWKSFDDYSAHYQRTHNNDMRLQLTGVNTMSPMGHPEPLIIYTWCYWDSKLVQRSYNSLLHRKQFTKWFYSLFFQLALPFSEQDFGPQNPQLMIHSPLNLSILFRIVAQLRVIGYPSHWMSECVDAIIENTVMTTTRPPRSRPAAIAEVTKDYPNRRLSTAPFADEMAFLAGLFQPLLPFSLTSTLPPLDEIYHYTLHFRNVVPVVPQLSCLVLLLWNQPAVEVALDAVPGGPHTIDTYMRQFLDTSFGDEVDRRFGGAKAQRFREENVVVWSTFRFDIEAKKGSAWMPKSLVEEAKRKGWVCGIWRVDMWTSQFTMPEMVGDVFTQGKTWAEYHMMDDVDGLAAEVGEVVLD